MSLLHFNPELARNLWLEIGLRRLLLAPLAIAASAILLYYADQGPEAEGDNWLMMTALFAFSVAICVWGVWMAVDSVATELREGTWDQQRLTGQGGLGLFIGKLFGATAYCWYVAALLALVLMLEAVAGQGYPVGFMLFFLISIALCGLIGQAVAMLGPLGVLAGSDAVRLHRTSWLWFLLLGTGTSVALQFHSGLYDLLDAYWENVNPPGGVDDFGLTMSPPIDLFTVETIRLYAQETATAVYALAIIALYAVLSLIAGYRMMGAALGQPVVPWGTAALAIVFTLHYGALHSDTVLQAGLFLPLFLAGMGYQALLAESNAPARWIKARRLWRYGRRSQALSQLPRWVAPVALLPPAATLTLIQPTQPEGPEASSFFLPLIVFTLFVWRDSLFLSWMAGTSLKRPTLTGAFFLLLTYGAGIAMLYSGFRELSAPFGLPLFMLSGLAGWAVPAALFSVAIQLSVLSLLLFRQQSRSAKPAGVAAAATA